MRRFLTLLALFAFSLHPLVAKDKQKKSPLPLTVLDAKTISIVIDPDARSLSRRSRRKPYRSEGCRSRHPEMGTLPTHALHHERRPHHRHSQRTGSITDASLSNPRNDGIPVSAQAGNQPGLANRPPGTNSDTPTPQGDSLNNEDSFLVYDGKTQTPLSSPAIWRYNGMDGLRSHSVPAVDAFRKAVAETEKIAAAKNQ